jgi:hypothetical protein
LSLQATLQPAPVFQPLANLREWVHLKVIAGWFRRAAGRRSRQASQSEQNQSAN